MTSNSLSDPYEVALREMSTDAPNLDRALELLEQAHADGDRRATYALATWYLHGKHVDEDPGRAVSLLTESAAQHPDAMYDLAVCYEVGKGVDASLVSAACYYMKAALHGHAEATEELGRCFWHGVGIGASRPLATVCYERAKDLGACADEPDDSFAESEQALDVGEASRILQSAKADQTLIRVARERLEGGWITGYVACVGPDLVVLNSIADTIDLDGYQSLFIRDITRIDAPDRHAAFVEHVLGARGKRQVSPLPEAASTLPGIIEHARRFFPLISVHRESKHPDACHIGKVLEASGGSLTLLGVTPDGVWEDAPRRYGLDEITRIDFGGRYEDALALAVGGETSRA